MKNIILGLISLLLLCNCGTSTTFLFHTDERPLNEIGVIIWDGRHFPKVVRIDGYVVESNYFFYNRVELPPASYKVTLLSKTGEGQSVQEKEYELELTISKDSCYHPYLKFVSYSSGITTYESTPRIEVLGSLTGSEKSSIDSTFNGRNWNNKCRTR